MKRTSFSLPEDFVSDLSYVSRRLGVTRSALVSELMGELVCSYAGILRQLPEDPDAVTDADLKRFRGSSVDLVKRKIQNVKDQHSGFDLFS